MALGLSKIPNPFYAAYLRFRDRVFVLSQLNEHIPKAVDEVFEKRQSEFKKKISQSNKLTPEALERLTKESKDKEEVRIKIERIIQEVIAEEKMLEQMGPSIVMKAHTADFIRDMSLVYLVSIFESFLQDTLEVFFEKKPESLITEGKTMLIQDLIKHDSVRRALHEVATKETASILREDIVEIHETLEKRFKVDLARLTDWKAFTERFYRRNIVTHNAGVPNEIYRQKTGYAGKVERLAVSHDYLRESIELFSTMAREITMDFSKRFGLPIDSA